MKKRILLFCVVVLASCTDSYTDQSHQADMICEQRIEGHFVDAERVDSLMIRLHASDDSDEPPDEDFPERCADYHSGETQIGRDYNEHLSLFYIQAGSTMEQAEKAASDVMNAHEIAALRSVCRDPDTGLDQLLFLLMQTGISNGEATDALFVFYDKQTQHFATMQLGSQFVDDSCSVKSSRQRFEKKNKRSDKLYATLQPPAAKADHLMTRALPDFYLEQIDTLFSDLSEDEPFTPWEESTILGIQQFFYIDGVAENERWRIVSVNAEKGAGVSWGVLLLEDKRSGQWKSFYDVPHEYSSKVFLFQPHDAELKGDILQLALCTDCSSWGYYAPFQINLNTLSYTQVPDSGLE